MSRQNGELGAGGNLLPPAPISTSEVIFSAFLAENDFVNSDPVHRGQAMAG